MNESKFNDLTADLDNLPEELRADIIDSLKSTINELEDDWLVMEKDKLIVVYSDGEDYEVFVDDKNWQRREKVKMLHWKLIVSSWLSEYFG